MQAIRRFCYFYIAHIAMFYSVNELFPFKRLLFLEVQKAQQE